MANIKDAIRKLIFFTEPNKAERFILKETPGEKSKGQKKQKASNDRIFQKELETKEAEEAKEPDPSDKIDKNIKKNLERMKEVYSIPLNSDIILREFDIKYNGKRVYYIF